MIPLYQDPFFTFRFADDRLVSRFHLADVEKGQQVKVIQIDPVSLCQLGLLIEAIAGDDGWVDLPEQIVVRAGEAFIVVPAAT